MTIDPQADFRKSDHARGWSEFFGSPRFAHAALVALHELRRSLPEAKTETEAANNHWRVDGAHRFLYILQNLAESPERKPEGLARSANLKQI